MLQPLIKSSEKKPLNPWNLESSTPFNQLVLIRKGFSGSVGFADLKADENTPIPVSIFGQKPFKKGFLAGAPCQNPGVSIRSRMGTSFKVDNVDRSGN